VAPTITALRQSARSWRASRKLATIARHRAAVGTKFSFVLSERATVKLSFAARVPGRKLHGRCVAQTERNRHKPKCARSRPAGALTFAGRAGANKISFYGRLSRSRALAPGSYSVTFAATNSSRQRSTAHPLRFTILAPARSPAKVK
jgi:hypothetical protein